jgi:catechol 2,3-dioxygenase-like lactoylglutathione lyase family enzyme
MIDHVSIAVRDLAAAARFYEVVLRTLGHAKVREWPTAIGFGKAYPEFWLNHRPDMTAIAQDSGAHVCLRAPSIGSVEAFHAAALQAGGRSDGVPGLRPEYSEVYYAAFIRDPEGNRLEAVTFLTNER